MYPNKLEQLDVYLRKSLIHLMLNWYKQDTGVVACALIESSKKIAFATSKFSKCYWFHAERNAIEKFSSIYGKPSPNAIMVTTLSPCILSMENRYGISCTELIRKLNIRHIHFGTIDTDHTKSIRKYKNLDLQVSLTEDDKLATTCNNLRNLLFNYNRQKFTDLLTIKKSFGDKIFYPLLS